jgi:eukaryotic-like serine/threonine-protein kinase
MLDRVGQQLGNYRLLRLLGQGGFADVYLGEHVYLRTQAAIKVLQMRVVGDDMESFLNEARTIANLKHAHIVRVLEFGVEGNTPFLVMEYASSGTLRQRYPKGTRLPLTTIVPYVKQVASALQYAHDRKLIHRDVKPENMLLESEKAILLSDFGIALVAQSSRYQNTQETVGTIAYMAPEQLQGKPRPASDQYSLGIVVYEWLSGVRPFHGSFTEMYSQHLFVPPPPLSEKVPNLPHDIETIIQIALAKEPQQRFATVQAFAAALEQANQEGLPTVVASPKGQPVQPYRVDGFPGHTNDMTVPAMPPGQITPQIPSLRANSVAQPSKHGVSRRAVILGLAGLVAAASGITWLALSQQHSTVVIGPTPVTTTPAHSTPAPPQHTSPTPSISVGTLLFTYHGHSGSVGAVAWSPDGQRISSGGNDGTAKVWDATSGNTLVTYNGHSGPVESVDWSPDGHRIVSGGDDNSVQVWDASNRNSIFKLPGPTDLVWAVAWSPDGNYIAAACKDKLVYVWNAVSGSLVNTYHGHTDFVYTVAWSPDSKFIASGSNDKTAQVWEATTGNSKYTYTRHTSLVTTVSWSPNGARIASGSRDKTVQIWDSTSGNNIVTYLGHTHQVNTAAWTKDGMLIASASNDATVQIWNAASGDNLYIYRGHKDYVWNAVWSPMGKRIASASMDGTVQIWQGL